MIKFVSNIESYDTTFFLSSVYSYFAALLPQAHTQLRVASTLVSL